MAVAIQDLSFDSRRPSTSSSTTAPHAARAAGAGLEIKFSIRECWLGQVLVAASDEGVCFLALGDESEPLLSDLQSRFPKARFVPGDSDFETLVAEAVRFVEAPARSFDLPLDVHGTAFQRRVWAALREIPPGATVSYAQIAARIGEPQSVRAVAGAIAANKIAVAIPCHRVRHKDGSLSGFRWGVERKRALLDREAGLKTPGCVAS
jgi:AraC family transcriptional regulator, regulatory protein of adaptative response / methylated-DNA-[protein]-cysteine methyltransferase